MLQLDNITYAMAKGQTPTLEAVSFQLQPGQIGCLLGPSGCGKTTLLRLIAGFINPSQGQISLASTSLAHCENGQLIQHTPSEKRGIGMLFQEFALFPHLNVHDNIAFGLTQLKRTDRAQRVKRYLQLTQLEQFAQRKPFELSGGQQQRVALARALAPHPKLLLMDEPFSSLDTDLRRQLSNDVFDILKQEGISALLVTHDQQEAMQMADMLGVMRQGRLHQWAPSYEVYHEPVDRFVANFVGHGQFILGTALDQRRFQTQLGVLACTCHCNWPQNAPVDILIRPDDLTLATPGKPALITKKNFQGAYSYYWLRLSDGTALEALFPSHHNFAVGEWIQLGIDAQHLVIFPHSHQPFS